tara:strand:- start:6807 stop:7046 length:240 start_codon:yes stop_codon:yes gene_type:complete
MAWDEVVVKADKKDIEAMQRGNELRFSNVVKQSSQLVVQGKSRKVESWVIDGRDDVAIVMLAEAGSKEVSDDKPTEGSV